MAIESKNKLRGVGGWLAFLIFSLMILSPLLSLGRLEIELTTAERLYPYLSRRTSWSHYKIVSWGILAVAIVVSFAAGYRLWKSHRPETIKFTIWSLWLIWLIPLFIDLIAGILILNASLAVTAPGYLKVIISSTIGAGLWTWYLKKSVRVKNTYQIIQEKNPANKKNNEKNWWRSKSRAFRLWVFLTIIWFIFIINYLYIMEPYGYRMNKREILNFLYLLLSPPIFIGAGYYGYKRFVH